MKVTGLDGREYSLNLNDKVVYANDTRKRSELHMRCRNILNKLYPLYIVCEEVVIPATNGSAIDFFLPELRLAIECQGEQHYKYIQHFHGTKLGFLNAMKRDRNKKDWCDSNNIRLVELKYDGSDREWSDSILGI